MHCSLRRSGGELLPHASDRVRKTKEKKNKARVLREGKVAGLLDDAKAALMALHLKTMAKHRLQALGNHLHIGKLTLPMWRCGDHFSYDKCFREEEKFGTINCQMIGFYGDVKTTRRNFFCGHVKIAQKTLTIAKKY